MLDTSMQLIVPGLDEDCDEVVRAYCCGFGHFRINGNGTAQQTGAQQTAEHALI